MITTGITEVDNQISSDIHTLCLQSQTSSQEHLLNNILQNSTSTIYYYTTIHTEKTLRKILQKTTDTTEIRTKSMYNKTLNHKKLIESIEELSESIIIIQSLTDIQQTIDRQTLKQFFNNLYEISVKQDLQIILLYQNQSQKEYQELINTFCDCIITVEDLLVTIRKMRNNKQVIGEEYTL